MKKRFGIIIVLLILLLMALTVSCKDSGESINYNKEQDLPEEANLIILTDMKYNRS